VLVASHGDDRNLSTFCIGSFSRTFMPWDKQRYYLKEFEVFFPSLGIPIPSTSEVKQQLDLVRHFLQEFPNSVAKDWLPSRNSDFKRFYDAAIVTRRLTEAVVELRDQPRKELRERLSKIVLGPLTQGGTSSPAKDFLFELEMGNSFKHAGYKVTLREPDLVIEGNGITRQLGVACKYPSSRSQIHEHLSKGYRQVTKQNLDGLVAIGLDLIVTREAFGPCSPNFFDFNQGGSNPLNVVQELMSDEMKTLALERSRDYPAEHPLDGSLLSLQMWGIYNKGFAAMTAWALQCDQQNPLFNELKAVKASVETLVIRD
jgi:hypothetical protein